MTAPLPVSEPASPLTPLEAPRSALTWNILGLLVALAALGGSLWLSLGMGLQACPLCYYQRTFVMGAAAVLLIGLMTESRSSASLALLAIPLAAAGVGVAGWHVYLELKGALECPKGVFGVATAPQQSLAAQLLLLVVLGIAGIRRPVVALALVVGGLLAYGAVATVAPMPRPSAESYEHPPIICRPPLQKTG